MYDSSQWTIISGDGGGGGVGGVGGVGILIIPLLSLRCIFCCVLIFFFCIFAKPNQTKPNTKIDSVFFLKV